MTVKELMDILAQQDADAEIDLSKDNILQAVSIVDNGKFFEEKRNDLYCFNKTKNNNMIFRIEIKEENGNFKVRANEYNSGITEKSFGNVAELLQYVKFYMSCFLEEPEELPF